MQQLLARWQRLSKRQRLIVAGAGGVVTLLLVDAIALRPLRRQVQTLRAQVRDTERRLMDAVTASQQSESVNAAFAAYEPYIKPAGSAESELAAALSEVEGALRQSGVLALSLKPMTSRPGEASMVSVSVDGESDPAQLVRLLDLLARSSRLLKVTELTVRVSEEKTLRSSMVISKLLLK